MENLMKNIFKFLSISLLMYPLFSSAMEKETYGQSIRKAAQPREEALTNNRTIQSLPQQQVNEKSVKNNRPRNQVCYVDIPMYHIKYYTGPDVKFYNEYKAQNEHDDQASFPINKCDPLLFETSGNVRWFFGSAIEGHVSHPGEAIEVIDPSITHVYAVRGKADCNGYWVQVYFGIDANNPKFFNTTKKVYQGKILYLLSKSTRNVENTYRYYSDDAKYLSNMTIGLEMRNHLDQKDCDWKSPVFQQLYKDLFCKNNGSYQYAGDLLSNVCYWTKEENKLKGIKYGKK